MKGLILSLLAIVLILVLHNVAKVQKLEREYPNVATPTPTPTTQPEVWPTNTPEEDEDEYEAFRLLQPTPVQWT